MAFHPTSRLAMMKLGGDNFAKDPLAQLAALDCRALIRFDLLRPNSRTTQADLVKTYMRCVFNIPNDRESMWSGYPSEPILAEAAARLLNQPPTNIQSLAPTILESALNKGLLARGERGELVARTLLTVAHDLAIMHEYTDTPLGPYFHRPVRFVELLKSLLAPDIWDVVRKALPFHAYPGDVTLEDAYKNGWVNFSHFAQLGNHESFSLAFASELLKRGVAMQTFDNNYNMDIGLPIHHGDPPTTIIGKDNTSMGQFQIKNASSAIRVYPDPTLAGLSETNLPVISIVMQLGVENSAGGRVKVRTIEKGADGPAGRTRSSVISNPADIRRRHYVIELYGCSSKTYHCIPVDSGAYRRILRADKLTTDFPRSHAPANLSSLLALKPVLYNDENKALTPWS
jgi:hypothetical protein